MKTKHTPGPWHIDASKSFYVFASGALAEQAGVTHGPFICNASSQANAALIAQAPDLLAERDRLRQINAQLVEALEDASFLLAKIGKFPGDLPQFMGSIIRSVQDARAALAKAKVE